MSVICTVKLHTTMINGTRRMTVFPMTNIFAQKKGHSLYSSDYEIIKSKGFSREIFVEKNHSINALCCVVSF